MSITIIRIYVRQINRTNKLLQESQSQVSLQSEKSVTSQKSQKSQNENKDWKPYHGGTVRVAYRSANEGLDRVSSEGR